ncbi:hypothetical protein XELAEV_18006552mg [Xenopus laevis]|uniref:Complexin-1 n=1 Tax=Xenopus laevis TaxID=8355 RepID=A0A974I3M1_XENLA|nr:hypothetical protein XELAEV_18006552mg [Xenopus laevis]
MYLLVWGRNGKKKRQLRRTQIGERCVTFANIRRTRTVDVRANKFAGEQGSTHPLVSIQIPMEHNKLEILEESEHSKTFKIEMSARTPRPSVRIARCSMLEGSAPSPRSNGATKDMGKMLGGEEEEKDPDAQKKMEEAQEALRQEEEERKAKYAKIEAERETMRQGIRDKYGIKKREEKEAEAQAAMEATAEGSLTRPKKAIPPGCGDEEEEEESILDTVIKYLPGPLQDMFKK